MTVFEIDDAGRVLGQRCTRCGHATVQDCVRCPSCASEVESAAFGPEGTVWASTVVRIPIPGRVPPFRLAYVDLDDGPRVLAHIPGDDDAPLKVGGRAVITSVSPEGDLEVASR